MTVGKGFWPRHSQCVSSPRHQLIVVATIVGAVVVVVATWISARCSGIVEPTTLWCTTCALCNLSALLHCGSARRWRVSGF